jgi:hypothetical protein
MGSENVVRHNGFWPNKDGRHESRVVAYDNLVADPLFVDRVGQNYTLTKAAATDEKAGRSTAGGALPDVAK